LFSISVGRRGWLTISIGIAERSHFLVKVQPFDNRPTIPRTVWALRQKREGFAVIFMSGYRDPAALESAKIGAGAIPLSKPFPTE
jgi:hypothetical protein